MILLEDANDSNIKTKREIIKDGDEVNTLTVIVPATARRTHIETA